MNVILEGCDCVGKSTFAELLAEKTGYEIVKGSSFEISELGQDGMYKHMMELLNRDKLIIDRFFYSNLVYGSLYKYPMMTMEQYLELQAKLNKTSLVVYLHTSQNVIKNRMANRGDDMIKVDDIGMILEEYHGTMHGLFAPKTMISLETSYSDFRIATAMIADFIQQDMTRTYIKL
jgi:thymidylate kinase